MKPIEFDSNEVIFATSDKTDGNMSVLHGDETEVLQNRKKFLESHGFASEDYIILHVPHEDKIEIIDSEYQGSEPIIAEALITKEKGRTLCLLTADCFPLVYFDNKNKIIALAHLGWKPTGKHLASKVIDEMKSSFNSNPKDIVVVIGPGIHKESYVVEEITQRKTDNWLPFLENLPDKETRVDILGYIKKQLLDSGVLEENLKISPTDTAVSENYFSHYRSKRTNEPEGRFMTVIGLRE